MNKTPPVILLVGSLPPTKMRTALEILRRQRKLKLHPHWEDAPGDRAAYLAYELETLKPAAILVRPAAFPEDVSPSHFKSLDHPVLLGNLGSGTGHLARVKEHAKIRLILPKKRPPRSPGGGPTSVAQLTVFLAKCLRRPLHEAAQIGRLRQHSRKFRNNHFAFLNARLLEGSHWLCLGSGHQVRALLPLLKAYGVGKVSLWTPHEWDAKKFCLVTSCLSSAKRSRVAKEAPFARIYDGTFTVEALDDYKEAAKATDIVSIHLRSDDPDAPPVVDATFLGLLKKTAHVINVARGQLVDEDAVVQALDREQLGGFASDVINGKAESTGNPEHSPLWRLYFKSQTGIEFLEAALPKWNLILLPHLGGSTIDAFEDFDGVISQVLEALGFSMAA